MQGVGRYTGRQTSRIEMQTLSETLVEVQTYAPVHTLFETC